jgi:hypothetical protein
LIAQLYQEKFEETMRDEEMKDEESISEEDDTEEMKDEESISEEDDTEEMKDEESISEEDDTEESIEEADTLEIAEEVEDKEKGDSYAESEAACARNQLMFIDDFSKKREVNEKVWQEPASTAIEVEFLESLGYHVTPPEPLNKKRDREWADVEIPENGVTLFYLPNG